MNQSLQTLNGDFKRAAQSNKLEISEAGILIPGTGLAIQGEYFHTVNGEDLRIDKNLLTTEFLNYLLMVGLHTLPKVTNWYLSIFAGAVTPAINWTAASYPGAASELTSAVEGYDEVTRPLFNGTATSTNQIDNLTGGKATFTIATATQLTVRGAALSSNSAKGATTGILASASRFASDRVLFDGDSFDLGYRVTLNAA